VEVGDVDAAYTKARNLRYEIVHPLTDEAWGVRRFFVCYPHGNVINIVGAPRLIQGTEGFGARPKAVLPDRGALRALPGTVALFEAEASGSVDLCRSDRQGQLAEGSCDPPSHWLLDAEFVVSAADVLHERVSSDDDRSSAIGFETAHRLQAPLELPMICLDAVIGVLLVMVPGARHQLIEYARVDRCLVGHHFRRGHLRGVQRPGKKALGSGGVPPFREVDINDLAKLIDSPVHITPDPGDLHIRFVHPPAVADRVPTRSSRFR
jgi:hypothetical protein